MFEIFLQTRELILSKTAKATSVIFLGNITSSVLGIVFTILAARFLGPENWGLVAAVGSLTTILVAVGDFGLGAGVFRFASGKWSMGKAAQAEKIYRTIFSVRLATATFLTFLLFLFARQFAQFFLRSSEPRLILFTALGVFGTLLLDFQVVAMQARQSWKAAAVFISLTNTFRVLGIAYLVAAGNVNIFSALLVFSGSTLVAWFLSFVSRPSFPSLGQNWLKTLTKIGPFSSWMAGNKIVSSINSRIDVLLLISLAGAYDAGIYAAANRLVLGVPLILGSFATVLAPRFTSIENKQELGAFFKRAFGLSVLISLALVAGVVVAPLVMTLFGGEYQSSRSVLQWLLLAFIPFTLSTPAVNILIYHFQKPQVITLLSLFQLPFIFGLNFFLIPRIGVFSPVVTLVLVNLSTLLVTFYFSWRYFKQK